jgi:hypothetical protein
MDKPDKDQVMQHFGQLVAEYTEMVVLGVTGLSVETRQMAHTRAMQLLDHIQDDLLLLVESATTVEPVKLDEDFQMWANEFQTPNN